MAPRKIGILTGGGDVPGLNAVAMCSYAAQLAGLGDVLSAGWVPLAREGRISYRKPVPGDARATSRALRA